MKKPFFLAIALLPTLSVSAQYTKYDGEVPSAVTTQQNPEKSKVSKAIKEKAVPVIKIEAKYGVGSCPVVDGKIEWTTTIPCPGLTANQIYENALKFLAPYCKEHDKSETSQIALVNPSTHEIGARIGEYVVFRSSVLSLDRAMFHYTLCLYCSSGQCRVEMKNMSYKYEGNVILAEDMLLDKNALNKSQTDFRKGGYRKFRTKTIDAKDALFQKLGEAISKH